MTPRAMPQTLLAALCGLVSEQHAQSDTIVTENGERLTGTVERWRDGRIELETL